MTIQFLALMGLVLVIVYFVSRPSKAALTLSEAERKRALANRDRREARVAAETEARMSRPAVYGPSDAATRDNVAAAIALVGRKSSLSEEEQDAVRRINRQKTEELLAAKRKLRKAA